MSYTKTNWQNGVTPINETNLNKMENGIATANNVMSISDSGLNLNDYINDGIYFFYASAEPSNRPTGVISRPGYLEVRRTTSTVVLQRWTEYNTINNVWQRQKREGSWEDWVLIGGKKGYIRCSMTNDLTISADNTAENIKFDKIETNASNGRLSVNNNGEIGIGYGVSTVRVYGQYYFYTGTANNSKSVDIKKNNDLFSRNNSYVTSTYTHQIIPSAIIPVTQGDKIKVTYTGKTNDVIKNYEHGTYLYVEIID